MSEFEQMLLIGLQVLKESQAVLAAGRPSLQILCAPIAKIGNDRVLGMFLKYDRHVMGQLLQSAVSSHPQFLTTGLTNPGLGFLQQTRPRNFSASPALGHLVSRRLNMPKTIAQRLSALEKTVAAFLGRGKTRAKKAVKTAQTKTKRVAKKARKSTRRKTAVS